MFSTLEFDVVKQSLVGKRFPVLDQGFVELMDAMGGDAAIVEAARTTSQKEPTTPEADEGLLRYLMRHRHSTPVEMTEFKFRIHMPMDAWRQHIRHRMASVNEYSTRYSEAIDECQETPPGEWRLQSKSNRQGSSGDYVSEWPEGYVEDEGHVTGTIPKLEKDDPQFGREIDSDGYHSGITPGEYLTMQEEEFHQHARQVYQERLHFGVAKEVARKDLPLSTYTEAVWKIDGHNLLHYLGLRMDSHAQLEIRSYANVIGEQIVAKLCPVLWQAFCDYRLNAMTLTALDQEVIRRLLEWKTEAIRFPLPLVGFVWCQWDSWKELKVCRERDECLVKLQRLGLVTLE